MIISANAAVIAASAAIMNSHHYGGGFGGSNLKFIVLMTLFGALAGFIIGFIMALSDPDDLKEAAVVTFGTCLFGSLFMGFIGGAIIGIMKIVEMIP